MSTALIALGIVLIAAAAAGNGLKAFGVEVGPIASVKRQGLVALVGAVVATAGAVMMVVTELSTTFGASPPTQTSPTQTGPTQAGPTQTTSGQTAPSQSATTEAAPAGDEYVAVWTDTVMTMPAPSGCGDAAVTATFTSDGPRVETGVATLDLANPSTGDVFYHNCSDGNLYQLAIPPNNPFTRIDGEPDPAACAAKAWAQPIRKQLLIQELSPGDQFCLVSEYNDLIVHLTFTDASPQHDLTWTATAWVNH